MDEFVSEGRHFDNLFYVRELLKLDLDDWVQKRRNGHCLDDADDAMDIIENISIVENCIGGIHAQMAALEELKNGKRY